jgi:DNA topoisomerase I
VTAIATAPSPEGELVARADPEEVAEAAGLLYESDARPGITRRRRGRGFSYLRPNGEPVSAAERDRIQALVIPPAWTDVWISPSPRGHIQATGRDQRGRKQYRYHDRWREVRDADKFDRLAVFGVILPDLRAQLASDLGRHGLPRERVLALVVRLLDETLIRVGNSEYAADNDTYGLTTLRRRHARASNRRVEFDFVGKSGIEHEVTVADPTLARLVRRTSELGGQDLFTYEDADGATAAVTSSDVNDYLRSITHLDITAKDFRTWGGTVIATETLATIEQPDDADGDVDDARIDRDILVAVDAAAGALRNTRTVCRNCYIHPAVPEAYRSGTLVPTWKRARAGAGRSRAEQATLAVLEDQPAP